MMIRLRLTSSQKKMIARDDATSRYVYNRGVDLVEKEKWKPNFHLLRDRLVTGRTKKEDPRYIAIQEKIKVLEERMKDDEKSEWIHDRIEQLQKEKRQISLTTNTNVEPWELETPKDIRAGALKDLEEAYSSAFTLLSRGHIKFFKMHYRKKGSDFSLCIPTSAITLSTREGFIIYPGIYPEPLFKVHPSMQRSQKFKDLVIKHDCRLVFKNGKHYLAVPVPFRARASAHSTVQGSALDQMLMTPTKYHDENDHYDFVVLTWGLRIT